MLSAGMDMEVSIRQILVDKVPEMAVSYCVDLWKEAPFNFKVTRARTSKYGDYRYWPKTEKHQVTVNGNLNPYQFLVTYVHEVAHRRVHRSKGDQKPHGKLWKDMFKALMLPLLNAQVFPDDVLRPLAKHMKNPKASAVGDLELFTALQGHNKDHKEVLTLAKIADGNSFSLKSRVFEKIETKRTRALCQETRTGRKYLISLMAEVQVISEPN